MPRRRALLLLVILFTLLFAALIAAGSYLLSANSRQYAVAAFLVAFAAAFGQIAALALYIRSLARSRAARTAPNQTE